MAEYKLTKEDYKSLEKLAKITQEILGCNNELCNLEIKNKKDTIVYQKLMKLLKELICNEQEIYTELSDNPKKITAMLFYIMDFKDYDISEVLQVINAMPNSGMIKGRIAGRFECLLRTLEFGDEYEFDDEEYEEFNFDELPEIEDPEELERQFLYSEKLGLETERDILNTILKILKEYLDQEEYISIRNKLIQFKYRLSFLFKTVEEDFLASNFEINPNLFWGASSVVELHNGKNEDFHFVSNGYAEDILYDQEENLMDLKLENLNDIENYSKAVIAQIMIRACLLFVDDGRRDGFKSLFLSDYEFDNGNPILDGVVNNTFNKFEQDKELPLILSFKPKN